MEFLKQCVIIKKEDKRQQTHTWAPADKSVKKLCMNDVEVRQMREALIDLLLKEGVDAVMKKTCTPFWNAFTEKIQDGAYFRMFVDLDWKIDQVEKDSFNDDLKTVLQAFNDTMNSLVGNKTTMLVALRLPYKLHVHFPDVIVDKITALKIHQLFGDVLKKTKPKLFFKDVLDKSVYNSGLRIMYCHKGGFVKPEKLKDEIKAHVKKFGDAYIYCYRLVDPQTLEPLKPTIEHLEMTSILTNATNLTELPGLDLNIMVDVPKKKGRPPKNANTQSGSSVVTSGNVNEFSVLVPWIENQYKIELNGGVKVLKDSKTITFGTTGQQYCPFVERSHNGNNVYMKVDDKKGVRQMCHDSDCKGKEHNVIAFEKLPEDAQMEVQKSLEIIYNDHQKLEMFEKQVQASCKKDHPKNNFELNYNAAKFNTNGLLAKLKDLHCLTCNKEHEDPNSFLTCNFEGRVLFQCWKQLESSSLTTLPPTIINNVFQGFNIVINNTTVNHYANGNELDLSEFGEYVGFPNIMENEELNFALFKSLSGNSGDVSKFIEILIRGRYVRVKNKWYEYTGICWEECLCGPTNFVNDNIAPWFRKLTSFYDQPKQVKWLNKIADDLCNEVSRRPHIRDTADMLDRPSRPKIEFDSNSRLIPFKNGVYDSESRSFREHSNTDYITEYIDYDFEHEVDLSVRQQILKFFEDIMEDSATRKFLLEYLALHLYGRNRHQMVAIFTGIGSNGKGILKSLIKLTFKQFHSEQPATFLTSDMACSNSPTANLASIRNKFSLWMSEVKKGVKINGAFLKFISGGDDVRCRFNHSNEFFEYVPRYLVTLLCNEIPLIEGADDDDNAIWRRVKIIEFKTEFKEHVPEEGLKPHQRLADTALSEKIKTWGPQMMLLLTEIYNEYVESDCKLNIPESVKVKIEEQKNENKPIREFFQLYLEKCDGHLEHLHTIRESYINYMLTQKGLQAKLTPQSLRKELEKADFKVTSAYEYVYECCPVQCRCLIGYKLKS